ncbi:MAG TPA: TadE/TadG family type IV pilus assembly protein [Candidatus Baltobacteraceae bacterium]|nr:TadE/TadG family type IV pilus assembly protein [Candidatus Baltobacteraceae bacterium]
MRKFERGSSMVEFAIAATALLLLVFGILEFGRVLYIYHTVSNAARLGSRWAIVRGGSSCTSSIDHCSASQTDISAYVLSQVPMLDSNTMTVTAQWNSSNDPSAACSSTGTNTAGHTVCVTVSYPFNFAIPFVSNTALSIASTSSMVISQ